jgi:hypothetical protein
MVLDAYSNFIRRNSWEALIRIGQLRSEALCGFPHAAHLISLWTHTSPALHLGTSH